MGIKQRMTYSIPIVVLLVVPDIIFFHTGVMTIVGLIVGYIAWKKGPEFGEALEREGLHPRGLLPGKVVIKEIAAPAVKRVREAEPEDYGEEQEDDGTGELARDDYVLPPLSPSKNTASSGDLQALEAYGYLQPGADFVLAVHEDGTPVTQKKLSSMGFGGRQGSGKTVSMLSLVVQAIAKYNGAIRFLVIDPHMNIDPEEEEADNALAHKLAALGPFLLKVPGLDTNPVSGGKKLLQWLVWLNKEFKERLGTDETPGKKAAYYIVIVADEFGNLLADATIGPKIIELFVHINEQARKVKMFALVASPTWKASRMQGTDLRNSIASFLIHNMPANIAQQIVDADVAQYAPKLGTGEVVVYTNGVMDRGWVPYVKPVDLAHYVEKYKPSGAINDSQQPRPSNRASQPPSSTGSRGAVLNGGSRSLHVPTYEEGLRVHKYYAMLKEVGESDTTIPRTIAIIVYGDETKSDVVQSIMELREKHGI